MADQDWDKKINELRDVQLVTQRIIERQEKAWNERFERHDEEIAELRAAMTSLITHIDQFIRGRGPNGH